MPRAEMGRSGSVEGLRDALRAQSYLADDGLATGLFLALSLERPILVEGEAGVEGLFERRFLVERPLLKALRAGERAVLLIDEVDRSDDEFEAFLLEVLSDFQVTVPEVGTIRAERPPKV